MHPQRTDAEKAEGRGSLEFTGGKEPSAERISGEVVLELDLRIGGYLGVRWIRAVLET